MGLLFELIEIEDWESFFKALKKYPLESIIYGFIAFIWIVEVLNRLTGGRISQMGIIPRKSMGLLGIITSPFIHNGFAHVSANTVSLIIFGFLISTLGIEAFICISILIILAGGLLVWIFARKASHVGASLLVYGYIGVYLGTVIVNPTVLNSSITLGGILFYGGILRGVMPVEEAVSWEGHLFGLICGFLIFYYDVHIYVLDLL